MTTAKQQLGDFGELLVAKHGLCPNCKRVERTLRQLPQNFKCADIICDFCGWLAQVKTKRVVDINSLPKTLPGAAWGPQEARMRSAIFISLYIVLSDSNGKSAGYLLPKELQTIAMFESRSPLSDNARRAGWQGFTINLKKALGAPVRVF